MLDSGNPLPNLPPNGSVKSLRTHGKIPTLFPSEADIYLASVDGTPNPSTPVERRAWACWQCLEPTGYPGTRARK